MSFNGREGAMVRRGWSWGGVALVLAASGCSLLGEDRGAPVGAAGVDVSDASVEEDASWEEDASAVEDASAADVEEDAAEEDSADGSLEVSLEEVEVAPECLGAADCPAEPAGGGAGCWEAACAAGVCVWEVREGEACGLGCQEGGTCDAGGACVGWKDACPNSDASDPCLGVFACAPGSAAADGKGCVEVSAAPAAPGALEPLPDPCEVWACLPCDPAVEGGCLEPGVRFARGVPRLGQACGASNRLVCGLPTEEAGDDACVRLRCEGEAWVVDAREPTTCDVPVVCAASGVVSRSYMTCGGRQVRGLLGFWGFTEGEGQTAHNLAGRNGAPGRSWSAFPETSAALDLEIVEPNGGSRIAWRASVLGIALGEEGLGRQSLLRTAAAPVRVYERLEETGAFTVELWLRLEQLSQNGPARIVTFSGDTNPANHNLMLAQDNGELKLRLRGHSEQRVPEVFRPAAGLEWTHLVVTYASGLLTVYVNGAPRERLALTLDFSLWQGSYRLGVGNELSAEGDAGQERAWAGELGMIALFEEALSAEVVRQHFGAGVPRGLYNLLP